MYLAGYDNYFSRAFELCFDYGILVYLKDY